MSQTGCTRCDELKHKCPHCVTIDDLMVAESEVKDLREELKQRNAELQEKISKAYDIGWKNTGEGWNGEYPGEKEIGSEYYNEVKAKDLITGGRE